jgi:hypothetical protein
LFIVIFPDKAPLLGIDEIVHDTSGVDGGSNIVDLFNFL